MRAFLLILTTCLLVGPAPARYAGGTGEPNDPYLIYTAAQMNAIGANPDDWDRHFKLMADIDLAVFTGTGFNIIGHTRRGKPFTGVFDGNGHTISHFTYDTLLVDSSCVGVFGRVGVTDFGSAAAGEIRHLGLIEPQVEGGLIWAGALVGSLWNGSITACYVEGGSVSADAAAGGLVGTIGRGTLVNCRSTARVTGRGTVGGLVGRTDGGSALILDCCFTGTVVGSRLAGSRGGGLSHGVGGLVGMNSPGAEIANSYASGEVTGYQDVGGLVGTSQGDVTHCYSTCAVGGDQRVGGLMGDGWATACFWDIQTSGQVRSAGGTGKTTAQMQDLRTYLDAGWDWVGEIANGTSEIWQLPPGGGYPVLTAFSDYPPPRLRGAGTPDDPYLISDPLELGAMRHYSSSAHYRLGASIDLSGIHWAMAVIPRFEGTFDGSGHTISHVTIAGQGYLGLFGRLAAGAEVRNLGVVDANIVGSGERVGALVGWNGGTVSQCSGTGVVKGTYLVGGLVGWNFGGQVSDSYTSARANGSRNVGGLAGGNSDNGIVTRCYSTGVVSSSTVGGLVGWNTATVIGSLWDTHTSGQAKSAGGTGKTTAEMQTAKTFLDAGWDFVGETANGTEDIWWIDEGKDYPKLWWEAHP